MESLSRFFILGIGSLCLASVPVRIFADDISAFPLTPRLSGMGLAGTYEVTNGDAMAALLGNRNGIWLLDAQGKSAFHSSYVGSVGTGLRIVQSDQRILGAYVFGDSNISPNHNTYWFVSPGIESMGTLMDFRMNGYIPVGTQRNLTGTGFADTFGNFSFTSFTGHDQFNAIVNNFEEVGWGLDGEVGVRIAPLGGIRIYAGGYHFNLENTNNIDGFAGRVQIPFNSFVEFNVRDSYDNDQHNTIEVGLRFTLGGVNKSPASPDQPIRERLLDPIERNLATLGQGTAEPVVNEQETVFTSSGQQLLVLERDNIWFFSPSATDVFVNSTSCTAEAPCVNTNFTQPTIDAINAHPNSPTVVALIPSASPSFYLAPGQYSALTINGVTATPLVFTNDLVYGRSADFMKPQQAAFLNGAVILNGTDLFDSIIFQNVSGALTQAIGLTLNTGSHLILTNSLVGADSGSISYPTAIQMNSAALNALNDQIHAYSETQNVSAIGIETVGSSSSTINLTSSLVQATGNVLVAPSVANFLVAAGIDLNDAGGSTVNTSGTTINASGMSALSLGSQSIRVAGIYIGSGPENIRLISTGINATGNFTSGSALVMGIGSNITGPAISPSAIVSLQDSTINANLTGMSLFSSLAQADGISLNTTNFNQVFLTNSTINANSQFNQVINNVTNGIHLMGGLQSLSLTNSQVNAMTSGNNEDNDFSTGINITGTSSNVNLQSSEVTSNISNFTALSGGTFQVFGININAPNNNLTVNNSTVAASIMFPGPGLSNTGIFVEGIRDTSSVSDHISVTGNSLISADADLSPNDGVLTGIEVDGINQIQSGNSTGNITIDHSQVEASISDAGSLFINNSIQLTGIQSGDQNENITLNQANIATTLNLAILFPSASVTQWDILTSSANNTTISVANSQLTANFDINTTNVPLSAKVGNISSTGAGNSQISVNNSTLTANATVNTINSGSSNLQVNNINTNFASDLISITNSALNATGTIGTLANGASVTMNIENIDSSSTTSTVTLDINTLLTRQANILANLNPGGVGCQVVLVGVSQTLGSTIIDSPANYQAFPPSPPTVCISVFNQNTLQT
jgi:hypothetical protein